MPRPSTFGDAETRVLTTRLPVKLLEAMDELIALGLYKSKNQIIAEAVEDLFSSLALAIEVRYLAQKRAKEIGKKENEIPASALLKAMGEILQEHAEEFEKRDNKLLEVIGKVMSQDPEKAYEVALKLKEVVQK